MSEINEEKIINENEYHKFFQEDKLVISASDRKYKIPDALKKICVLFSDGDVLIEKNSKNNLSLRTYITGCTRRGYEIKNLYLTDMSLIRRLYENTQTAEQTKLRDEQPMERIASLLLKDACQVGASDIHIEVGEYEAAIFFRVNGDMQKINEIDATTAHSLLSTLYNAADNADATYKLFAYQSARVTNGGRLKMPPELQSLRLQFNPLTSGGRYMIARLLYANKSHQNEIDMMGMGFHKAQVDILIELMREPEGVNIIAGPTGSGKSTTLKAILEKIYIDKERKINIISVEDPPEYQIEGTTQLPVTNVETEEERGMAYSKAIVSALRSDPDIIMPGEARDAAVINLVFTAAMTGHQVWTSIHANSAMAVISRLRDQGVEKYKLTDSKLLMGIVSQRLVKRLCDKCKIPFTESSQAGRYGISYEGLLSEYDGVIDKVFVNNAQGCPCCAKGYTGRVVVAEIIKTDFKILDLIYENEIEKAYQYWTEEIKGLTIYEHGWLKVIQGCIDPYDAKLRIGNGVLNHNRATYLINHFLD
ncbi:hypothetical protein BL250_10520 [Erwinia sp. OLTSP20]|uniref:GspE/PulE family protein n=1 Tax=unclassified Erwinia TaxID=2622719 RepID=UPI000C640306|nr:MULTISPECIES: ATPase, T2SS/T4P/T4SS family [unclassified Erwinia]PIJ49833.1 hypothetical protein BV501_11650 [Erwinia sp. OAMSP11]PIJ70932.1 hypothetical protein BK416_12840 [Erwinia sp. OLSSP12]PIJ80298.1 hypothetical protein BLD47_11705 [Erwinia sp. OLCASP19]PIJ82422.1 hypothetical protein BLD46_11455 [Erwinia sp. OLMTSP26]PIJ85107.1 hypothetical protein BLD49_11565 [Erwinia sp. OLMDSP33]